jgi:hypothetical protein
MEITKDTFIGIRRAFVMFALAKASHMTREEVEKLNTTLPGFKAVAIPTEFAEKLKDAIANGDVTCIVPNPEPAMYVGLHGSFGNAQAVYGIWNKPASWKGTIAPPKRHLISRDEAILRGIPMPDEAPIGDEA